MTFHLTLRINTVAQAPKIKNLKLEDASGLLVRVSWETDIQSTSQIRMVDYQTGASKEYKELSYKKQHSLVVPAEKRDSVIVLQAISESKTFALGVSQPLVFKRR